jgi:hypothetical protein
VIGSCSEKCILKFPRKLNTHSPLWGAASNPSSMRCIAGGRNAPRRVPSPRHFHLVPSPAGLCPVSRTIHRSGSHLADTRHFPWISPLVRLSNLPVRPLRLYASCFSPFSAVHREYDAESRLPLDHLPVGLRGASKREPLDHRTDAAQRAESEGVFRIRGNAGRPSLN